MEEERWDNLGRLIDVIEDEGNCVINYVNLFIMDEIGMEKLDGLAYCAKIVIKTIDELAWLNKLPELPEEFFTATATIRGQLARIQKLVETAAPICIINLKVKLLSLIHDYQHAREQAIEIAEDIYAKREINP